MISVRGRGCSYRERLSIAPPDSFPPPKSEFSKQPAKPSGPKPPVAIVPTTDVTKYFEDDLKWILKTVLKA